MAISKAQDYDSMVLSGTSTNQMIAGPIFIQKHRKMHKCLLHENRPVCGFRVQIADDTVDRISINDHWQPLVNTDVIRRDRAAVVDWRHPRHMNRCSR